MSSRTWSELLQDNRWQLRRLEILSRDKNVCQCCGAKDGYMQVHHILPYIPGLYPWEYSGSRMTTLCRECHKEEHFPPVEILRIECLGCSKPMTVDEIAGWSDALTGYCEKCAMGLEDLENLHELFSR